MCNRKHHQYQMFFSLFVTRSSKGDRGYTPGLNRMQGEGGRRSGGGGDGGRGKGEDRGESMKEESVVGTTVVEN